MGRLFYFPSKYFLLEVIAILTILLLSIDILKTLEIFTKPPTKEKLRIRKEFGDRLSTIQEACEDAKIQNLDVVEVPQYRFLFERTSNLFTCTTAKHGSTTWSNYFVTLWGNG